MNIAHTDLKPGDRFRLTEVEGPDECGLTHTTIWEGTVARVGAGQVFYGPNNWDCLVDHDDAVWERLALAEPKNLGAVVEFTDSRGETIRVVRTLSEASYPFYDGDCTGQYSWGDILEEDANPRVLHEGWDGK